ncbi:hypothetical protein [Shewanella surugensis]|uniref:DUF4760 domain-containing protein n=1 Tax=Shewanella surugensis TaxID=212020 RepID=A0ABT0L775_9GAMM|nr:hypothetical protein [Shewanella surugensis]MCL1123543.1 hypothetical protein [Shewanella surugensis]
MTIIEQILTSGVTSVVMTGLLAFIGKIWIGRILAKEKKSIDAYLKKEQTKLDKGLHIHKVKFEKEFQIYQDIWAKLVDLKQATLSLRPIVDRVNSKESHEDRKMQRLKEYQVALNEYLNAVEYSQPFYAEDVYASLREVFDATYEESIKYKYGEESDTGYWEHSVNNIKKIIKLIDTCQKVIRKRHEEVHILE